jgi:CheY-like chemotaxis protein
VIDADAGVPPIRVLVADDQELVRGGFRLILERAGMLVLAEAADGRQAVDLARDSLEPYGSRRCLLLLPPE